MNRVPALAAGSGAEFARRAVGIVTDRVVEARDGRIHSLTAHPDDRFDVVMFFAGTAAQLYQVRHWLGPLTELDRHLRVAILFRDARNARAIAGETSLPVRMSRRSDACNRWIDGSGARLVLYANHNTDNFQTLRLRRPAHAHVNHGESEKIAMVSNQLKAYDRTFVAGPASRERILHTLVDFDPARIVEIGRPQIDVPPGPRHLPESDRTTVLYAPTWEGDTAAMAYGSVADHGVAIATAVLASPRHRLLYRPHPQTGTRSRRTAAADQRIRELTRRAAAADPAVGHVVDDGPEWGWQWAEADVCVCDVSAVVFDWLATGKPLLLTPPDDTATEVGATTDRLPRLADGEEERVLDRLSDPADAELVALLVAHHFGDTSPGASMGRFVDACRRTVTDRRRALGEDDGMHPA